MVKTLEPVMSKNKKSPKKKRTTVSDSKAWELTLECSQWIWACIHKRAIPEEEKEDCYQIVLIQVFQLMKRYKPEFSKTGWANYGILKGFARWQSISGTLRLPMRVIEKIQKLQKHRTLLEADGIEMSPEEMEDFINMNILDILTAEDTSHLNTHIKTESKENFDFFYYNSQHTNEAHNFLLNGEPQSIEEWMIEKDLRSNFYKKMKKLSTEEIFVILHRYKLDHESIPYRIEFFQDTNYNIEHYITDPRLYFLQEIGTFLEISKEKVRQIERAAVAKLKHL